ncbi:MAG: hypothetical protein EBS19_14290, partial [Spirochaetia bacterium]|nr:hypothetical protein [Spirochaetia bacterium]
APDENNELFSEERLIELIKNNMSLSNEDLIEILKTELRAFSKEYRDDVSMIILEIP